MHLHEAREELAGVLYGLFCRLGRPAAEYPTLDGAIRSVAIAPWRFAEGTWFIESTRSATEIRDAIRQALEPDDVAMVFPLRVGPAVWTPLSGERYGVRFLASALERETSEAHP